MHRAVFRSESSIDRHRGGHPDLLLSAKNDRAVAALPADDSPATRPSPPPASFVPPTSSPGTPPGRGGTAPLAPPSGIPSRS